METLLSSRDGDGNGFERIHVLWLATITYPRRILNSVLTAARLGYSRLLYQISTMQITGGSKQTSPAITPMIYISIQGKVLSVYFT